MAKQPPKPQAPPPLWDIYKAAAKAKPLGTVEAADADEAIEKAAEQFKVIASKLIAVTSRNGLIRPSQTWLAWRARSATAAFTVSFGI
jgi:hypothetical protein